MEEQREENVVKCDRCDGPYGTKELHSCPFEDAAHSDNSDSCNCCKDCTHQCFMDS